jgi:hypothetical protein
MSQTRIKCEGCGYVQVNCQCKHKGTELDLAIAVAELLGWKFHKDGWLVINCAVWEIPSGHHILHRDIKSAVFSTAGRELMEKYSLRLFVRCNFKSSTTNWRLPEGEIYCECDIVGMIKGILYRGEGSHQDMNIACALAYHEFVTGNKFELVDGGEVTEVAG